MVDISIVIVNYNTQAYTLSCIDSIKSADWSGVDYEIIVVDNNSGDKIEPVLKERYPDIIFIQSPVNRGMGAGNNIGFKKAQGKYLVVMNPDTLATREVFMRLFEYMESHKDVAVVAPQLCFPDGTKQASYFRWYSLLTPAFRRLPLERFKTAKQDIERFLMKDYDGQKEREVDWLMGSFLFCRREALQSINYFDERYFMYFEDTDLCRSFWNKGWRVVYYPDLVITHNHARESAKLPWYVSVFSRSTRWHITSWLKYLLKWGIRIPQSH